MAHSPVPGREARRGVQAQGHEGSSPPLRAGVGGVGAKPEDIQPVAAQQEGTPAAGLSAPPEDHLDALRRHFTQALDAIQADVAELQVAGRHGNGVWHQACLQRMSATAAGLRAAIAASGELEELKGTEGALRLGPVELGDLLMGLLARWKPLAPAHSFELALPGELPAITADAARVERALDILLASAVALSPAGGTIHVHIRPHADEVIVSIRHFGKTLSAQEIEEIFAPFFCPTDLPYGLADGGLGPELAATIVAAHGGRVWAEAPTDGVGGSLAVAWPLIPLAVSRPTHDAVVAPAQTAPPLSPRLTASRARQVALIVDGDYRMLRYLRTNLEARQYRALVASDLEETLRLVDQEEPDVIMLAAEVDGAGSAEAVRRVGGHTQAPVIVLARHYDAEECARLLDLGAADYLVKPFHLEELCARLRVALRPRPATTYPQTQESVFRSGELTIDFAQRTVTMGERAVALSKTEFKLLRELARHAGMVMAHEQLLERVWGPAYSHEIEFVWVYIRRLRRKIEPEPGAPRYILTVPGIGYRLVHV